MGTFYEYNYKLAVVNNELTMKKVRELIKYDYEPVERFISRLEQSGYKCHQTLKGTLIGDWICVPQFENGKYFIIREHYLNEWSSYMTVEPKRKLSKADQAELAEYKARIAFPLM